MWQVLQDIDLPMSKDKVWQEALFRCLGEEALDLDNLARRRNQTLGGSAVPMGLGDFFFDPNDPLHPDHDLDDEDDDDEDDDD